ncbi:MAG: hypothetical protein E7446_06525 [Ruminococcaceae bacterium]|nr:hypothetical protein [Oscillospiraceae bacterium]
MRRETDLEQLKRLAKTFLYFDIQLTDFSPLIVKHPFTTSGITGLRGDDGGIIMADLVNNPEDLDKWREAVKEQIDEADSAFQLHMMVDKSYALGFLKYAEPYLSEKDFGQILSSAWISNESPNNDPNISKHRFVQMFKATSPEYLMDAEELMQLQELDDTVTIYRGVTSHNHANIKALSWTLDRDKADWFAHRFGEEGTVYEAQIDKEHILALFNGRNEAEVIIDPRHLKDIIEAPEPEQSLHMTM